MSTAPIILKQGDVFEGDASWIINDFKRATDKDSDFNILTLDQSKTITDNETKPIYNGPHVMNVIYSRAGKNGKDETLQERLEESYSTADIVGKRFLVIETRNQGSGSGTSMSSGRPDVPYPNGHHVTAIALEENNQFDLENSFRVQFYQTGFFNCMIRVPKLVGRMPVKYGEFEPIEPDNLGAVA